MKGENVRTKKVGAVPADDIVILPTLSKPTSEVMVGRTQWRTILRSANRTNNVLSVKLTACFFISEPHQLVSNPEDEHHTGKPKGNSGESRSCHSQGILPPVLQVIWLHSASYRSPADRKQYRHLVCSILQAAHEGCEPPGDIQERCSREAVGQLQRANQTAPPSETGGQPGPQPQSQSGLHWYPPHSSIRAISSISFSVFSANWPFQITIKTILVCSIAS